MQAPTTRKFIQLAFHDCLKNVDSNGNPFGGCDGCLNWEGVDFMNEVPLGNVELMVDRHWTRAAWRRQSTKRCKLGDRLKLLKGIGAFRSTCHTN